MQLIKLKILYLRPFLLATAFMLVGVGGAKSQEQDPCPQTLFLFSAFETGNIKLEAARMIELNEGFNGKPGMTLSIKDCADGGDKRMMAFPEPLKLGVNMLNGANEMGRGLFTVYPNPVKERASIRFYMEEEGAVQLLVYSLMGTRQIPVREKGYYPKGINTLDWDREGLLPGIYYLVLSTPVKQQALPIVLGDNTP